MLSTITTIYVWLLVLLCISIVKNQTNLYNTDRSRNTILYQDCFRYMVEKDYESTINLGRFRMPYQTISYCVRPAIDKIDSNEQVKGNYSLFRFNDLNKMNVTVLNLIRWSISFDLVEDYQEYLDTDNYILAQKVINNCSRGWFGLYCQYSIYPYVNFDKFIYSLFSEKNERFLKELLPLGSIDFTCYMHLNCTSCIDWREICDGKIDCPIDGADEENCLELEMNECAENEYRCHNGLCIPESFLNDYPFHPDCLDRTDEQEYEGFDNRIKLYRDCFKDPGFRCEESYYIGRQENFHCGDGETSRLFKTSRVFKPYCTNQRDTIHWNMLHAYEGNTELSFDCWRILSCALDVGNTQDNECNEFCHAIQCVYHLQDNCHSNLVFFPQHAIFHNHVRFVYLTNETIQRRSTQQPPLPDYVCYDNQRCPFLRPSLYINGSACKRTIELKVNSIHDIDQLFRTCSREYPKINHTDLRFRSLFQCPGTNKLISKHRLLDGIVDCFGGIDENNVDGCSLSQKHRFKCQSDNKCIALVAVYDGVRDCAGGEDETYVEKTPLSFYQICNGFLGLERELIGGQNETDETNCEDWPCDNMYTRCDGAWSCLNGTDESRCRSRFCPQQMFPCVLPYNLTIICLPISHVNDGTVHCLGASDERAYCRVFGGGTRPYRCWNFSECVSIDELCTEETCLSDDTASICSRNSILEILHEMKNDVNTLVTLKHKDFFIKSEDSFWCSMSMNEHSAPIKHPMRREPIEQKIILTDDYLNQLGRWRCNRGVPIKLVSKSRYRCFCPPSYYGDHCQFQNQRISLTLTLRKICAPNCFGVFRVLVILFDNKHIIHSQEQITFLPTHHCDTKFNIYLLYDKQPKNEDKNYTIQVNVYNRIDMLYHASWMFPVLFAFLPVNRISVMLTIPATPVNSKCSKYCGHGKCVSYLNVEKEFCLCNSGWSGEQCLVPFNCSCAYDSLCLGVIRDESICLCPLHKTGLRCLIPSACSTKQCSNDEYICIPFGIDDRKYFLCHTKSLNDMDESTIRFEISFSQLPIPQLLLTHFIIVDLDSKVERVTAFSRIKLHQDEAILYFSRISFRFILFQILRDYYLSVRPNQCGVLTVIKTSIDLFHRCPHIRELVDQRTSSFPLLRRVKYYYKICQQYRNLRCFHDEETFMCLCTSERHANCFHFDFNMTYDCEGSNDCKNNGQCFTGTDSCPTWITCACLDCFYGSQCQFTTKGVVVSLDAILGYSIRPHASLNRQSTPVKVSMIVTIFMLCLGCINSTICIMIFRTKKLQEIGCGCYLLSLSIISLLLMIVFTLKFIFLLLSQMAIVANATFLYINCISMDFLLRSFLSVTDWLNASIAIERMITTIKGVHFNKKKSRSVARLILIMIIFIVFGSNIHDPIHRQITEDKEDERFWCIVQYNSSQLEFFNSIMNILHFVLPFSINLISPIIIIIMAARQRTSAQKQLTYRQHLCEQWHHHNHLIISSIVLVVLAIPRLIISFLAGCMKSARNPWFFLTGYFISHVPPLLTFIIYILPSKTYKEYFDTLLMQYRTVLRCLLCTNR